MSYEPRITLDQLVSVFLMVFVLLAPVLAFGMFSSGRYGFGEALALALMIAAMYSSAVMCSVYPRDWWSWAHRDSRGTRPWLFYIVSGLLAAAIGALLSFATRWLLEQDLQLAWSEMSKRSPWLLMAFAAAFTLSLLGDDERPESITAGRWRLVEGGILAAVLALCGVAVCFWLLDRGVEISGPPRVVALAAVVGFSLGCTVPTWYREEPEEEELPRFGRQPQAVATQP